MNTESTKLKGPYEILMKVHVTDGKCKKGSMTLDLILGDLPEQKDIEEALSMVAEEVKKHDLRLMTKAEFVNMMAKERLGATESYALPKSQQEWDK